MSLIPKSHTILDPGNDPFFRMTPSDCFSITISGSHALFLHYFVKWCTRMITLRACCNSIEEKVPTLFCYSFHSPPQNKSYQDRLKAGVTWEIPEKFQWRRGRSLTIISSSLKKIQNRINCSMIRDLWSSETDSDSTYSNWIFVVYNLFFSSSIFLGSELENKIINNTFESPSEKEIF